MLNAITFEKVEEIIALAAQARRAPHERADDPRRGGPAGDRGVSRAAPPMDPQPALDWADALPQYLDDLSGAALQEVAGLYRFGRGEFARLEDAVAAAREAGEPPRARAAFLAGQPDLAVSLRRALERHSSAVR
jgi:hypothetical protein